jgi:CRISPR-associated protein Cas2
MMMRASDGSTIFTVLVIYDITDNKHRLKVSKLLDSYGTRVQRSCYEAKLTSGQYQKLLRAIKRISIEEDNIRIYKINGCDEIISLGTKDYTEDTEVIII